MELIILLSLIMQNYYLLMFLTWLWWILGVIFGLGGISFILNGDFFIGVISILIALFSFPLTSPVIMKRLRLPTTPFFRIIPVALLIFIGALFYTGNPAVSLSMEVSLNLFSNLAGYVFKFIQTFLY